MPAKRGGNGWLLASRIGTNARYTTVQVRDGGSPTSAVHGLSPRRVCAAKRQSAHLALFGQLQDAVSVVTAHKNTATFTRKAGVPRLFVPRLDSRIACISPYTTRQ